MADICMYSQRSLKDYALIGMGVDYHDPAGDLAENSKLIRAYFTEIESHGLKPELDAEVREMDAIWQQIEPRLMETPAKEKMSGLQSEVDDFARRCEDVADHLATDTGNAAQHYVVLIAELGMQVQRLTALYMMKAWGGAGDDYYGKVEAILKDYQAILAELISADESLLPAEIKARLKATEKHFLVFQVMVGSDSGRYVPTLAEKKSSHLFDEFREILKLEKEWAK